MHPIEKHQLETLFALVESLYADGPELLFHGWHHVEFVYNKAAVFAEDLAADVLFTQSAALVHDLNYLAHAGVWTPPSSGESLRLQTLSKAGYTPAQTAQIEETIIAAETACRGKNSLTPEMMALSDADTLFKALPTTAPIFAARFMQQNNYSVTRLARKIVAEQVPLLEQDIYFYSDLARRKYTAWAKANLAVWQYVEESLADPDILKMLEQAGVNTAE